MDAYTILKCEKSTYKDILEKIKLMLISIFQRLHVGMLVAEISYTKNIKILSLLTRLDLQ